MIPPWRRLIEATSWGQLENAYGSATGTAADLMVLADPEESAYAFDQLSISVLRRGALYSATFPAILVVAHMAATRAADLESAFALLEDFAESVATLPQGNPRHELAHRTLAEMQLILLPLVAGEDVAAAQAAALQGVTGQLAPGAGQILLERACQQPTDDVALAAAGALGRAGGQPGDLPCDWRFDVVAAWLRLLRGEESEADIDLVTTRWEDLREVRAAVDPHAQRPWDFLPARNPSGARRLYSQLPDPEAAARGLLAVIQASRSEAARAQMSLLEILSQFSIRADVAVYILQHLVPTSEVCDALDAYGSRAARPKADGDNRADVAAALAVAGDPRWEEHLLAVLETNPRALHVMVSSVSSATKLGYAFGRAPVVGSERLAREIAEVLAEERMARPSEGVKAVLWWLAHWGSASSKVAREQVLAWSDQLPGSVARVVASWGDKADARLVRQMEGTDPEVRFALASLSGELEDWRALLHEEPLLLASRVLEAYPEPDDPEFIDWAAQFLSGDGTNIGQERLLAADRLVAADVRDAVELWPGVVELIDAGNRVAAEAASLAVVWLVEGRLTRAHRSELSNLLRDVASSGRGIRCAARETGRAAAARAWLLLGEEPAVTQDLLVEIVQTGLADWGEHGSVLDLLTTIAEVADGPSRQAVLHPVREVLASDARLRFFSSCIIKDEAERAALTELTGRLSGPRHGG